MQNAFLFHFRLFQFDYEWKLIIEKLCLYIGFST